MKLKEGDAQLRIGDVGSSFNFIIFELVLLFDENCVKTKYFLQESREEADNKVEQAGEEGEEGS